MLFYDSTQSWSGSGQEILDECTRSDRPTEEGTCTPAGAQTQLGCSRLTCRSRAKAKNVVTTDVIRWFE